MRQNGQMLVIALSTSELYQVDPLNPDNPLTLVHRIPGAKSLFGIAEMQEDVFYAMASNWSTVTFTTTSGSYSVWKIVLRQGEALDGPMHPLAIISKVTDIPEGILLDGMTVLNKPRGLIVVGDCRTGVVYTLDVETGRCSKTMEDATMKPGGPSNLEINGMRFAASIFTIPQPGGRFSAAYRSIALMEHPLALRRL